MLHEMRIAFQIGQPSPYFKWPYHATVMNTLDASRRTNVVMAEMIAKAAAELHPSPVATVTEDRVIFALR
jgi:hypothetical protein